MFSNKKKVDRIKPASKDDGRKERKVYPDNVKIQTRLSTEGHHVDWRTNGDMVQWHEEMQDGELVYVETVITRCWSTDDFWTEFDKRYPMPDKTGKLKGEAIKWAKYLKYVNKQQWAKAQEVKKQS